MSHVLVVDDEAGFREVLKRILINAGYDVAVATDAQDALRSIRESAPAIVFCDIHMPGRDGLWLCNQIRAISPAIAMILCTSDDTIPPMETLRDGIVAYVIKPFQRRAIVRAVADAAEWHTSRGGAPVTRTTPVVEDDAAAVDQAVPPPSRRRTHSVSAPRLSRGALLAIAAVAVLGAAVAAYWYVTTPQRVIARIARASGVIDVQTASGAPVAQGSGFFVSPDTFVTSLHVVRGGVKASVQTPDGARHEVLGVIGFHHRGDLVVLRVAGQAADVLALELQPPSIGDDVMVYGAPLGLAGTLSSGIVNATPAPEAERLQISAPISPGSSGSPVVNRSGRVVGVATEIRTEGEGLGFAVPAAMLGMLLGETGDLRPLIAASRGTGTDVDHADLIGDVRHVTVHRGTAAVGLTFDHDGRLIQQVDETAGVRTEYHYDDGGRLKTQESWRGDEPVAQADFRPSALGTAAPPNGRRQLDPIGNVARESHADGTSTVFEYTFDDRGNWIARQAIEVDAAGGRSAGERVTREIQYYGGP